MPLCQIRHSEGGHFARTRKQPFIKHLIDLATCGESPPRLDIGVLVLPQVGRRHVLVKYKTTADLSAGNTN